MITTGRIVEDIKRTDNEYNAHLYKVELPIFKNPGITNSRLNDVVFTATVCCDPSTYEPYQVGDLVYVGFVNNRNSHPVILGKILKYDDIRPSSYINADSINVESSAMLPLNTTIVSSDGGKQSLIFLKQKLEEIDTINTSMNGKKLYQHHLYIKHSDGVIYCSLMTNDDTPIDSISLVLTYLSTNGFNDFKHTLQATGHYSKYNANQHYDETTLIEGIYINSDNYISTVISEYTLISETTYYITAGITGRAIPTSSIVEITDNVVRVL